MNKTILVIVVIFIIIVGGYFIYSANQGSYGTTTNGTNITCTPNWQCSWGACANGSQTQVATDSNNCGLPVSSANIVCPALAQTCIIQPENLSASVSIKNFAFNPTPLTVKVGTIVTWTNNDAVPHQIKSDTFNSAVFNNGQNFVFTFITVGEYNYSCAIHPSMLGKIIVTQ